MTGILIVKPFARGGPFAGEVSIDDHYFTGPTTAMFGVSNVGLIYGNQNSDSASVAESWIDPQVGMSLFEVMVHQISGNTLTDFDGSSTLDTSPLDQWLQLNLHRWWGYRSTSGAMTGQFLVTIRRISDSVVMDSATFTLYTPGDGGAVGNDNGSNYDRGTGSGGLLEKTYLNLS